MPVKELKERLHSVIDTINNEEFLKAMLVIADSQEKYNDADKEQLRILKEREERYRTGSSNSISLEEFKGIMKNKYDL
jgi:hypothetical protein